MQIFQNIDEWRAFRRALNDSNSMGFVPTMGNLHAGHISLIARSKAENAFTVSSLFINPTQFNQLEDFTNYPRTLENDLIRLEKSGVDYCFLPDKEAMYPDNYHYKIEENYLTQQLEGTQRPGHFTGVLTIVLKLLNLVKARNAYFGEKDYQQYALIHAMANAFFIDTNIIVCPTIREVSGLPFSSRNNRLTAEERMKAEIFARIFQQQDKSCAIIHAELQQAGIYVEYVAEVAGRRFVAVQIGAIRLIDNRISASA